MRALKNTRKSKNRGLRNEIRELPTVQREANERDRGIIRDSRRGRRETVSKQVGKTSSTSPKRRRPEKMLLGWQTDGRSCTCLISLLLLSFMNISDGTFI